MLPIDLGKIRGKVESSKGPFDPLRSSGLAGRVDGSFAVVVESISFSVAVVEDTCPSGDVLVHVSDGKALSGPLAFSAADISCLAAWIGYLVTEARFSLPELNHLSQ